MLDLNLPPSDLNIKNLNGKTVVFDRLRKRFVKLSPEEWVRQNFIHYLITEKKFPASLLANEVSILLNKQQRRCDTVAYRKDLSPLIIIEYKAPSVPITQETFDQIVRYNIILKVDYLIVTNGMHHYCCKVDYTTNSVCYLEEIPDYLSIT